MRHEILIFPGGEVYLRRKLANGAHKIWCGREYGWSHWQAIGPTAKVYSTRMNARKALRRILAHERELGLHGCDYERV